MDGLTDNLSFVGVAAVALIMAAACGHYLFEIRDADRIKSADEDLGDEEH